MATASQKVPMKEDNSYSMGKGPSAKTTVKRASTGSPPNMGGNPRKGGGINRATGC